jgi:hypothetical protein
MRRGLLLLTGTVSLTLGCGDGTTAPAPSDGARLATQFERLADSVDAGGYSPAADALRHAAEIVRLTGHATPVGLTIDGTTQSFLAVAEQIDFPNLVCSWPSDSSVVPPSDTITVPPPDTVVVPPADSTGVVPPDGGGGVMPGDTVVPPPPGEPPEPPECTVEGTYSMRTLIAWEPEHMAEVVRIVADVGSNGVATGVPDVMTGLPTTAADHPSSGTTAPPDSSPGGGGGGAGGSAGFMGEYLVRDVGSWWAVEGTQVNALEEIAGACTDARATFDWAEFGCDAARLRFEFSMRVEPVRYEPLTGVVDPPNGPEGSHTLSMESSAVDGVRLTWVDWTPPPPMEVEPAPSEARGR